jgi:hypothetical protein
MTAWRNLRHFDAMPNANSPERRAHAVADHEGVHPDRPSEGGAHGV